MAKRENIARTPLSIQSTEPMIVTTPYFPPLEEYGQLSPLLYPPTSTPPFSPSDLDEVFGGINNENASPSFKIGDIVFYRGGDTKSNRQWRIKDIGNEFYTIETDDIDGIEDIGDTIRVVYPTDVYSPNSVVYPTTVPLYNNSMDEQSYSEQQITPQNVQPFNEHSPYVQHYPEINVNPIIKIVNGNDNSIDTGMKEEQRTKPIENVNDFILGGNINIQKENSGNNDFSVIKEEKSQTHVNKTENDIMSGGIDFSKLMIKKV